MPIVTRSIRLPSSRSTVQHGGDLMDTAAGGVVAGGDMFGMLAALKESRVANDSVTIVVHEGILSASASTPRLGDTNERSTAPGRWGIQPRALRGMLESLVGQTSRLASIWRDDAAGGWPWEQPEEEMPRNKHEEVDIIDQDGWETVKGRGGWDPRGKYPSGKFRSKWPLRGSSQGVAHQRPIRSGYVCRRPDVTTFSKASLLRERTC